MPVEQNVSVSYENTSVLWNHSMLERSLWRHQRETFSALLALCAGNSPVTGEFPAQRPVTRSFDAFFDLRLNKRLSKRSWGWWFETPSRSLCRHCYDRGQLLTGSDILSMMWFHITLMSHKRNVILQQYFHNFMQCISELQWRHIPFNPWIMYLILAVFSVAVLKYRPIHPYPSGLLIFFKFLTTVPV